MMAYRCAAATKRTCDGGCWRTFDSTHGRKDIGSSSRGFRSTAAATSSRCRGSREAATRLSEDDSSASVCGLVRVSRGLHTGSSICKMRKQRLLGKVRKVEARAEARQALVPGASSALTKSENSSSASWTAACLSAVNCISTASGDSLPPVAAALERLPAEPPPTFPRWDNGLSEAKGSSDGALANDAF